MILLTHLNGAHIDQIFIQERFFPETVTVSASVVNTYFSEHDAVRVECLISPNLINLEWLFL